MLLKPSLGCFCIFLRATIPTSVPLELSCAATSSQSDFSQSTCYHMHNVKDKSAESWPQSPLVGSGKLHRADRWARGTQQQDLAGERQGTISEGYNPVCWRLISTGLSARIKSDLLALGKMLLCFLLCAWSARLTLFASSSFSTRKMNVIGCFYIYEMRHKDDLIWKIYSQAGYMSSFSEYKPTIFSMNKQWSKVGQNRRIQEVGRDIHRLGCFFGFIRVVKISTLAFIF